MSKKSIRKNSRKTSKSFKKSTKSIKGNKKTRKNKKSKRRTLRKNYKKGGMMDSPDEVDAYLKRLPDNATAIDLTRCELTEIPDLSRFTELNSLVLRYNRIRDIPPYLMGRLRQKSITTFDIRNNDLVNIYILHLIRLRIPQREPPNIQFDINGLDMNQEAVTHNFGADINLDEFEFFDCNFEDCIFDNSSFSMAKFNNVSFKNAEFEKCDFNDAEFHNIDERGNMTKIDFTEANLEYSDFQSMEEVTLLDNADFENAVLEYVNFRGASLTRCNFVHATFDGTDFSNADLTDSFFGEDFLAGCDFTDADLTGVRFSGSDLSGCRFTNAVFHNTVFEDVHNIYLAIDLDINNPDVLIIGEQNQQLIQPEIQTGVAYRVHNKFSTIDLDKLYDFLSYQLEKDGHGKNFADTVVIPKNEDMARYITVNLAHYINTNVPLEDRDKYTNDLNRIAPGLNRFDFSKQISRNKPNVSFTRLITIMLTYIDGQPDEFMRDYIINFVAECVTAYQGEQSLSCSDGIKDRLIISLAAATMSLPENPEYEELKKILNANPLEMFQDFTKEWFKFRKANPFPTKIDDLMTEQKEVELENRKQDYMKFMKSKYVSIDVESKDVADKIMQEAENLKLGDMFQDYAFDEMDGGARLRKYYRKNRRHKKG